MSSSWFRRASASPAPASADPANAVAAQGRPLLLIGWNAAAGRWELGDEALGVLRGLKAPLCTVSVCGRARQGKSFLLNQMLSRLTGVDRPNGFVVSSTHQSCTRGIWIWSAPLTVAGPDGRKCSTILMDCEGVDAVDQGAQHSAQIFSLAVLLSSIFVFNQVGAIDAVAIERLAMVCELTRVIKGKSAAAGQVDFSPAFVWLLRDMQLQLVSNGRPISPSEYLEESLAPIQGGEADLANRNQMRATIKAVFPERDVSKLVRPVLTEQELQRLDATPSSGLRPEFQKDMDELLSLLRSKMRPLAVGSSLVSGVALAGLAQAYVAAVNQGAVPQLVTAWQGVSAAETRKAADAAAAAYARRFSPEGIKDDAALYEQHQAALAAALAAFKAQAMGDPELLGEAEARLREQLERHYTEARGALAASGEQLAKQMLADESGKLRELMGRPDATVEAVESELRRFLDDYDLRVPNGPYKYKGAAEFLMNTTIFGIKGIVKGILAARDAAAKRAAAAEAAEAQLRLEVDRLREAEVRADGVGQQLRAAQQEAARLTGQLEAKARHVSTLEGELAALRQDKGAAAAKEQQLQQEVAAARAEARTLQGRLGEGARLQGELERAQGQLAEASRREIGLQQARDGAQAEAARLSAKLGEQEAAVARLQAEAAAGREELGALRGEVAALKEQLGEAQAAQLRDSRIQGRLDEERAKVTELLEKNAALTQELTQERKAHDAKSAALEQANAQLAEARAAAKPKSPRQAPAPAAAAAAAASASAARRTQSARKRARTAADAEDEEMADAAGQGEPAPTPAPAAAAQPAASPELSPPVPVAPGTLGTVDKDIEPAKMTVAALKQWVTDGALEDDEFYKLVQNSKTKKADWVKYVTKKLQSVA